MIQPVRVSLRAPPVLCASSVSIQRWRVTAAETTGRKLRLDEYLLGHSAGHSRSQVQAWIRSGRVTVNGARCKTGYTVWVGDAIEIDEPAPAAALPCPEPIPLEILYQDADIAVVNKPAGLVTHAGAGIRSGTLVNALLFHLGPLESAEPLRPGIVHRLDKGTSGLLVVARNPTAHRDLASQFKDRRVRKEYRALVYGRMPQASGTIDRPIGRDPGNRKKFSTRARRRRSALTRYTVERELGPFSLLKVQIMTGRTHQIRVHLAHLGHPIAGDTLYGGGRLNSIADPRLRAAAAGLGRMFLHAERIEFCHPVTADLRRFEAPLPRELATFIALLERLQNAPP